MNKKQPLPIYLDDEEKELLDTIATSWGVSLSDAVRRLIRDKSKEV